MLLNDLRINLSHEETRRIRKKLPRIEAVYNVLKDKEKKGSWQFNKWTKEYVIK